MDKTAFFEKIRSATDTFKEAAKTPLPEWDKLELSSHQQPAKEQSDQLWKAFQERFKAVSGETVEGLPALAHFLKEANATHGYVAPKLAATVGPALKEEAIEYEIEFQGTRVDDYAFGITRAAGIIAETGSVVLKESSTASRLAALAPWIHLTIVDAETRRYATLYEATTDLGDDPYVVFATGPSKTADVEGILIEGVHGPGRQVCCRV